MYERSSHLSMAAEGVDRRLKIHQAGTVTAEVEAVRRNDGRRVQGYSSRDGFWKGQDLPWPSGV